MGRQVAVAFHGDLHESVCWTVGDELGNGPITTAGAYVSDIWFRVTTGAGEPAWVPVPGTPAPGTASASTYPLLRSSGVTGQPGMVQVAGRT